MGWCQSLCISITQAAWLFKRDLKSSQNRESLILLPIHILIRLLKSIIESLRLCLHKLPKHLVISISLIKGSAKPGEKISQISPVYSQNNGFFSQGRQLMDTAQKFLVFSSETRIQSRVLDGGCDFIKKMFGRCSDRISVQNVMGMKMT